MVAIKPASILLPPLKLNVREIVSKNSEIFCACSLLKMAHVLFEWILILIYMFVSIRGEHALVNPLLKWIRWDADLLRASLARCLYWAIVSVILMLVYCLVSSEDDAEAWTSGFILEYTLSLDNLFIFQLVFRVYNTPETQIDKALIWGIGIAAGLRIVLFAVGTSLFEWVGWLRVPFGVLLLITAYKTARVAHAQYSPPGEESRNNSNDTWTPPLTPVNSSTLVFAEKYLRFTTKYDKNGKFLQREFSPDLIKVANFFSGPSPSNTSSVEGSLGRLKMTMLGGVVLVLAFVDMVFALDAVAAKVTQTKSLFINASSSLVAMASFRSLYFVLSELTSTFTLLKFGVALILAYVAAELILSTWFVIPSRLSLLVIGVIFVGSVAGSMILRLKDKVLGYHPVKVPDTEIQLPQSFGLSELVEPDNPFT